MFSADCDARFPRQFDSAVPTEFEKVLVAPKVNILIPIEPHCVPSSWRAAENLQEYIVSRVKSCWGKREGRGVGGIEWMDAVRGHDGEEIVRSAGCLHA